LANCLDSYFWLSARSYGVSTLGLFSLAAACAFFYVSLTENGINRWIFLFFLAQATYAAQTAATGLAIIRIRNLSPTTLEFYCSFWQREAVAVWVVNAIILGLSIYLLRKHHHD
jgi:hypothetical protein